MEGTPEDMWTPYKQLYKVLQQALTNNTGNTTELEICLKKYKQNFANFLRNPPKNEKSRIQLRNATNDGITISGHSRKLHISKELVDEALILSDMFDLDEFIALELLCTAKRQMAQHPGLPRGLIAILLYYDGRKEMTCALRDLFQVTSGVSWATELPREITSLISTFTQNLVDELNILDRIIDLLEELDIHKESELLTKNRAFGQKKHQNQVLCLFEEIRSGLATALFNWSAQRGLPKSITIRLLQSLANYKQDEASGLIDDVSLTMLMALLYAYDTSALQNLEDTNILVQKLPIMSETDFVQCVYGALVTNTNSQMNRLDSIAKFSFGLSLASFRHVPNSLQTSICNLIDRDEQLIDDAISNNVFEFIYHILLEKEKLFKTEFFYRRLHMLFTDFIDFMHSKVTELRGRADETARTVISFAKEGLDPPPNLDYHFEILMLCIGKFYQNQLSGDDSLCAEYWGPCDNSSNSFNNTTNRSVSLFKFIRLAGELLPTTLFVPYLKMITGLTSSTRSARCAFNLLKQPIGLSGSSTLSWEHFFNSINNYYTNLRQENAPGIDTIYRKRKFNRSITPLEIEGLHAVFGVIRSVAEHDEMARIVICEHSTWTPPQILLGLLSCSVPIGLKADILITLAALAKSKQTAITIWHHLEASQIIQTIPTISSYNTLSVEEEIEQNECRTETYALTRGILDLLYTLVTTNIPKNLGSGPRTPGCDPYLTFVVKCVFLKFYNRAYKNPAERWEVGVKCLKLLYFMLNTYEVTPQDFMEKREHDSHPGYHLMLQLHTKSDMLRLILLIIDDTRAKLDEYSQFRGKESMEQCALLCLQILECALTKQNIFFDAHSIANCSIMLSGLNRILLDVNPRTRLPDFVLSTTKFITYNNWLPEHALYAVKILSIVSRVPNVSPQVLGIFSLDSTMKIELRQGFVECLEAEVGLTTTDNNKIMTEIESKVELQIKEAIIELFQQCLGQPMPNLTFYLLGFEINRDCSPNERQPQYLIEAGSNCTKSLVSLVENHMQLMKTTNTYNESIEYVIERAFYLIYSLCVNRRTSETILRYLRSCNDFVGRILISLPLKNFNRPHVLNQMSHLLKCISIELKSTASHSQISRFQQLCEHLLGMSEKSNQHTNEANGGLGVSIDTVLTNYYLQPTSHIYAADATTNLKPSEKVLSLHICNLLDCISLKLEMPVLNKLEFFDMDLTRKILKDCEIKSDKSYKLINVKKLHEILQDELRMIAQGQRKMIMQEIETVLNYAIESNDEKNKRFATLKYIDAWSQVTAMLFTCVPETALSIAAKKQYIIDIIQKVLDTVVTIQPIFEISILTTETILLLLVNLRLCYHQLEGGSAANGALDFEQNRVLTDLSDSTDTKLISKVVSTKTNMLSMKYIMKNILEWIMVSGTTSQKLRINLYTALLNFLRIVRRNRVHDLQSVGDESCFVSRLDKSKINEETYYSDLNQIRMSVDVLASFGDKLFDTFCHDVVNGHDICKMLALACIDMLLEMDDMHGLINFMSMRGYLSHIIESVLESDESLRHILIDIPENMKALYIYESKMATLLRLAGTHVGAEHLVNEKLLGVFSNMKVFDMHPDIQVNAACNRDDNSNQFVPSVDKRFRQILFPALSICDCLIATLGTENNTAVLQVMQFIISHGDMIEFVLRSGTPFMDIGFMQELSAITGIIARTAIQDLIDRDHQDTELSTNLYRIQKLMMSTYSRFILNERTLSQMIQPENILYENTDKNKNLHIQYFLEIAANLSLYCRNVVSGHSQNNQIRKYLFTTSLGEIVPRNEDSSIMKVTSNLNAIINQLKGSVEYYLYQKSMADNLLQQRTSLPNISFDRNSRNVYNDLSQRLNEKENKLLLCAGIAEQSLYLLWVHLDFYFRRAFTYRMENKQTFNETNNAPNLDTTSGLITSYDDILNLKKYLISIFNETFCTQLQATSFSHSETFNNGFIEALLRRIKTLIQFVPVN